MNIHQPIENQRDREKLWNYILEFQRKGNILCKYFTSKLYLYIYTFSSILVQPLKKLEWFNEPVAYGLVGQKFPAFSVTSTSFLTDSLQLISHGILSRNFYFNWDRNASYIFK